MSPILVGIIIFGFVVIAASLSGRDSDSIGFKDRKNINNSNDINNDEDIDDEGIDDEDIDDENIDDKQ